MFIRLFATTAPESPVCGVALHYLRSLIRLAPVRVIDPGRMIPGVPDGPWARHASLFHTSMEGDYVNVVCTEPSRWTWVQKMAVPKACAVVAHNSRACERGTKGCSVRHKAEEIDLVEGRLELWTAGVRNVLLIGAQSPTDPAEYATALKYDAIITDSKRVMNEWPGGVGIYPVLVPVPVQDHEVIRSAVMNAPLTWPEHYR